MSANSAENNISSLSGQQNTTKGNMTTQQNSKVYPCSVNRDLRPKYKQETFMSLEAKQMEIKCEESIRLEDGKHMGQIVAVEERTEPYAYMDLVIQPTGHDLKMKAGYPMFLNPTSKLGNLLMRFGAVLEIGKTIDPETLLKGKMVEFMTIAKPGKTGKTYANILPDSVKPVEGAIDAPKQ